VSAGRSGGEDPAEEMVGQRGVGPPLHAEGVAPVPAENERLSPTIFHHAVGVEETPGRSSESKPGTRGGCGQRQASRGSNRIFSGVGLFIEGRVGPSLGTERPIVKSGERPPGQLRSERRQRLGDASGRPVVQTATRRRSSGGAAVAASLHSRLSRGDRLA